MEAKGLISVIIPVYNVEKYLRECVDSVLSQTYKSYEIILVDDGSTDGSGEICDEYAEKHSNVSVIHKANSGPSATRNVGIKLAKGEYIYFLDSDDYIVPAAFEKLVHIAENENADIVFFDGISFVDGKLDANIMQGYLRNKTYKTDTGYNILRELNKNKEFHCSIPLLFIRTEFLKNTGILINEKIYCSEDMLFTYQLHCVAERVTQCPEVLYNRRYRQNSIVTSKKSSRHFLSCKAVYGEIRDFSKKIGRIQDQTAKAFVIRCAFNALDAYLRISKAEKKEHREIYLSLKKSILKDNAYGDMALKMRCCGKVFWFVYKVFEKTVGRLFV